MNTCGDCKFLSTIENLKGLIDNVCRAHPPQIVAGLGENGKIIVLSRWPMVRSTDPACGEFWGRE